MVARPATPATTHDERLWFGPAGWVAVVAFALGAVVVLYPVGTTVAVTGGVVVLVVGLLVARAWATPVRVTDGELWAGSAHLPLAVVGEVTALDREATRAELGPRLDARAHVCLRAWARTAVRVELLDPQDPTPYWLVSTRHPAELAAAVAAGRDRPVARDT
ncbi:DUF3093 domain-containing protein [uncultured Cellulomonas sp.]|uniref:DUF3093 domain-containing protein n=1 Tax=uncultured Cellulomonas sp. TaxID=189682 RepID=UPI002617F886|nr:DUF3093 domain-containing protein [uncultured Cellulomonas sp.]